MAYKLSKRKKKDFAFEGHAPREPSKLFHPLTNSERAKPDNKFSFQFNVTQEFLMTMTMEEKFESLFVAKAVLIKIHQRAVLQVWRNNILSTPTYLLCTNENKRLFLEIII